MKTTVESMIETWVRAYSVSLGNVKAYKRRLKELSTWDKPIDESKLREWACKKAALEVLISEL